VSLPGVQGGENGYRKGTATDTIAGSHPSVQIYNTIIISILKLRKRRNRGRYALLQTKKIIPVFKKLVLPATGHQKNTKTCNTSKNFIPFKILQKQ
jgi:hypothetical protein